MSVMFSDWMICRTLDTLHFHIARHCWSLLSDMLLEQIIVLQLFCVDVSSECFCRCCNILEQLTTRCHHQANSTKKEITLLMLLRRLLLFLYTGASSSPEELTKFLCATVNTRSLTLHPLHLKGGGGTVLIRSADMQSTIIIYICLIKLKLYTMCKCYEL